MSEFNWPIIKLEIQGMKIAVARMLDEYTAELDESVKLAINKYLTEENIQKVIDRAVEVSLDQIIKAEVERFYRYGDGREVVRQIVNSKLRG